MIDRRRAMHGGEGYACASPNRPSPGMGFALATLS